MIESQPGYAQCTYGSSECFFDVVDIHFDETFTAIPNKDYVFVGWKKRHRGFCGGSSEPCRLFTSGFEGHDVLMSFLESDEEVFYLEAEFMHKDDVGAETIKITGTWNYAEQWEADDNPSRVCTSTGQFVHEVIEGEGLYIDLQPGSVRVSQLSDSGCDYATKTRTGGGYIASYSTDDTVTARQISSVQNQSGVTYWAVIQSSDKYTLFFDFERDGKLIHGSVEYTRVK